MAAAMAASERSRQLRGQENEERAGERGLHREARFSAYAGSAGASRRKIRPIAK